MSGEVAGASKPSIPFRADIQGIRALAVLLVFANHLAPGALTGGYVGVDVFLVVSGYLITSLLLRESAKTGRVSLANFYARRGRRILPAATLVTLVTVAVALLTLPLLRVRTILTDALWATLFGANIRMANVGTDYFAIGEPPSPLQHYWSLSVEEQFYLVWPVLLLLCLLLLRRRDPGSRDVRALAGPLIVVVCLASFAWSIWATHQSPVTAYFSSFTRAWELGVGACCAILVRVGTRTGVWRQALAAIGLAAIVASAVLFTAATPFPSWYAALPVLGTAALVVAGEGGVPTFVGRMLSVRPLTAIGDWSYSLYLWHWPLIVLVRSQVGGERFGSIWLRALVVVVALVLSWATFRWVETPFRRKRWPRVRRSLVIYPVCIGLVVTTVIAGDQVVRYRLGEWSHQPPIATSDYQGEHLGRDPYVALVRASVLAAREERAIPGGLVPGLAGLREQTAPLGDCDYRTGTRELCNSGDPDAERSIVVYGDSHARALSPAVEAIARTHGYRLHVLVYSGCSANSLEQVDRHTGRVWDDCEDFKTWAHETIADLHPALLIVSTAAGQVVDPDTGEVRAPGRDFRGYLAAIEQGWDALFEKLAPAADQVWLVGDTPKLPREPGVCMSQGGSDLGDCAFAPGTRAHREAKASFAAARANGAGVVDAGRWFCAEGLCPPVVGRYIPMRDSEHMTPDYARWLAEPLAAALGIGGRGA